MAESENSDALDQRHDVSFRVLEPRSLGATGGQDAILVCLWHVVLLKVHAPRFQLRDVTFDVLDLPECLARLGGAGVWRRVQEARGTFAALVDYAASRLLLWLETQLLLIEFTRADNVLRWNIRIHWRVLQHGTPLGLFRGIYCATRTCVYRIGPLVGFPGHIPGVDAFKGGAISRVAR